MNIEVCDNCGHEISYRRRRARPHVYRVELSDEEENELTLCDECIDRIIMTFVMANRNLKKLL